MKTKIKVLLLSCIGLVTFLSLAPAKQEKVVSESGKLMMVCSPEFENLAQQMQSAWNREHADMPLEIRSYEMLPGEAFTGADYVLVNKSCVSELDGEAFARTVVGRDAIVPFFNERNPDSELLLVEGLSPAEFASVYTGESTAWSKVYMPRKTCASVFLSDFMGVSPDALKAVRLENAESIIEGVRSDPKAIGFCSLAGLIKMEEAGNLDGIALLPVDMDDSGIIDPAENIYTSSSSLSHGIFIGRFPAKLYTRVYAYQLSGNTAGTGLLEWMLTEGQDVIAEAGIMELGNAERMTASREISGIEEVRADVKAASPALAYLLAGIIIVLAFAILLLISVLGKKQVPEITELVKAASGEEMPEGILYAPGHTWAHMEKSGLVRLGVNSFLPSLTGALSRVILKESGEQVKKGEVLMTLVQNGKHMDVKAPVSGTIEKANSSLIESPALISAAPYEEGWAYLMKPLDWKLGRSGYLFKGDYKQSLAGELKRMKEFLGTLLKENGTAPVFQDGGELVDGVLSGLGPEIWEEFQEGFLK